jgi:hypothetical protein
MAQTVKLMFDGVLKECLVTTEKNGEITCLARDASFIKFPAGTKLADAVKLHNEHNKTKPQQPDEKASKRAEERAAWLSGK